MTFKKALMKNTKIAILLVVCFTLFIGFFIGCAFLQTYLVKILGDVIGFICVVTIYVTLAILISTYLDTRKK